MRHVFVAFLILMSPTAPADEPAPSRYAGTCARRCHGNSRSVVEAMLVNPLTRRRTWERVYIYSSEPPSVVCRCSNPQVVRHRRRADRQETLYYVQACEYNCRQGIRLFPDVAVVDVDGREHHEDVSILQYDSPIACLCTGIPLDPPPPPRQHPR